MSFDWHNYIDESEVVDLLPDSITVELRGGGNKTFPLKRDGLILSNNLPVEVPLSYCKFKEYNGAEEALLCLGKGLKIGKATINPPVFGVYTLLEITGNPFLIDFCKCTMIQKMHALYFCEMRERALPIVQDWHYSEYVEFDYENKNTWTELDKQTIKYIDSLGSLGCDILNAETWINILKIFETSSNGFEMIPGAGNSKWWFAGEAFGSLVAGLAENLQKTFEEIIWETPMALIGFTNVAKAKSNGVKGVCRPRCKIDVRRQMILTYLREINGELHPWQIDNPLGHKLTPTQKKHKNLVCKFEALQKKLRPKKVK